MNQYTYSNLVPQPPTTFQLQWFEFVIKTIKLIFSICIYIVVRLLSMYFVASFCDGKGCNFSKYIRPKSYTNWLGVRIPNALLSSIPIFSAASPLQCTNDTFWKSSSGHNLEDSPMSIVMTLVTQHMLQLRPNWSELRLMDYYHQIFCRFQKCKQKVPPPSLLNNEKSPFTPQKGEKNLPLGGVKGNFWVLRGDGGGTFRLHFWNLQKIWW